MKWEDTVMKDEEIELLKARCRYPVGNEGRIGKTGVESRAKFYSTDNKKLYQLIAEAQAEISFPLGKKAGIRKAVDFLKMHYCIPATEEMIKKIGEE